MRLSAFEFPKEKQQLLSRGKWLAIITLVYLGSVIVLTYLVMGNSQSMRTAWIEDCLSLIPPIVFLGALPLASWPPTRRFPYGFHRVVSIAFLCAAVALCATGGWLLVDAVTKLIRQEHTTIGGITLFGTTIWLGWLMLPVLVWGAVPPVILGYLKLTVARNIHDKVLFADAKMNKADWQTAVAAMVGVIGVGFGFWWADAVMAALISFSILRDGFHNLYEVVADLMDEVPRNVEGSHCVDTMRQIGDTLRSIEWIDDVHVRLREHGHVFFGEALVTLVDQPGEDIQRRFDDATEQCMALDWRLYDFRLIPTVKIERDGTAFH